MTLEEAIKINTINNDHNPNYTDAQREQAHRLGIEALEEIKRARDHGYCFAAVRLPGETEE